MMKASDIIALLALAASLLSLWSSFRTARLSKSVAAAEKRTLAHSVLVGVQLETEDLLSELRNALSRCTDAELEARLKGTEAQLLEIVELFPGRLHWLRSKGSEDPVLLEEYRTYALEAETRVSKLGPEIRDLLAKVRRLEPE